MTDTTCPKCGEAECKESHAHTFEGKARCWEVLAKRYLARAEKAEALAEYRLEALEARDRVCVAEHSMDMHGQEVATRCRYCDSWPGGCLSDCPTVTHPVEGPNENA